MRPSLRPTIVYFTLAVGIVSSPPVARSQIGGEAGSFSRLGFGARGMGMGNAMSAVTSGDVASYYNPALLPWAESHQGMASFGVLSLDRSLNFLSYSQPVPPNAGLAIGIVNAGVSNIDGRDQNGEQTGALKTSENELFLGFATRFKSGVSIGVNIKLFLYHLYTDINSTTAGVDFGILIPVHEGITLAGTVRDIGSRYKWSTSTLYGELGGDSEDQFPRLYTVGLAYRLPDSLGTVAGEIEFSSVSTTTGRIGVEVPLIPELSVRAGLDRMDLKQSGNGVKPTFGFSVRKDFEDWTPALHYAYVIEPFAPSGMHVITLALNF